MRRGTEVVVHALGAGCQASGMIGSPDRHEAQGTQGGKTLTAASSLTRRNKTRKPAVRPHPEPLRAILPNNPPPSATLLYRGRRL
jgi:hypothetical protein